jgi:hypothetical protein
MQPAALTARRKTVRFMAMEAGRNGTAFYVEIDDPNSQLLRKQSLTKRYVVWNAAGVPRVRLDPPVLLRVGRSAWKQRLLPGLFTPPARVSARGSRERGVPEGAGGARSVTHRMPG